MIAILTPAKMQAAITDPVELDSSILAAFIQDRPKIAGKYLTGRIESVMVALATIDHDNRFAQELSPPCYYLFDTKTDSSIYSHFLEMVVDELKTTCDVAYMEAIMLDFCEGWNDYKRYLNGEYSAQQIIKYHTNRIPRSKRYTKVDAYAAGINTAARYEKKVFFWTNSRFYKRVGGLATIPEEVE